jgi:DNA-binding transcriptional MerR regulator
MNVVGRRAGRRESQAHDHHRPARRLRGRDDQGHPPLPPAWPARRAAARLLGLSALPRRAHHRAGQDQTLAEAGVPLARIKELLAADPDRFAAAITEIDHTLQQRAEQLQRTRERIAQLRGGDRLFVSAEVADYLDRLRDGRLDRRQARRDRRSGVSCPLPGVRRGVRLVPGTTRAFTRWPIAPSGGSPSGATGSRAEVGRDRQAAQGGRVNGGCLHAASLQLGTTPPTPIEPHATGPNAAPVVEWLRRQRAVAIRCW